ncbi:hypothetical protein [uncultured Amnibacterium sp.]|uniref:hypothetical protein n=1 Tax=uncultured Amnibacterium sp. TaxID=1631851 RepID=UPI0035CABF2A
MVLALGLLVVIAGVVVLVSTPFPFAFGWTAYSPLSDVTYSPAPPRFSLVLIAVLLVGGGFLSGIAAGSLRRSRRRS